MRWRPSDQDLRELKLYIEPAAMTDAVQARCDSLHLVVTKDRMRGDMFVSPDPTNMGQRSFWAAVIRGAYVTVPSFIEKRTGPVTKYLPTLHTPRWIWMSEYFKDRFIYGGST